MNVNTLSQNSHLQSTVATLKSPEGIPFQSTLSQQEIVNAVEEIEKSLAIIDYDWSTTESAYKPKLHPDSPRTNLASYLLEVYKKIVHNEEYLHRIKKQYFRVKSLMLAKSSRHSVQKINQTKKTGRNDLCDCGSGKKYKKCCLAGSQPELFRIA